MSLFGPKTPKADDDDYKEVQGGKPTVSKENGLTVVTHDYNAGEGMQVRSHIDHGTVTLKTSRGDREFQVDELRKFHGEPCEKQSQRSGGKGYDRTGERKS